MKLLTSAEVADALQITEQNVKRRCRTGEFPHSRYGKVYRFTAAQLEQIVAGHEITPTEPAKPNAWGYLGKSRRTA